MTRRQNNGQGHHNPSDPQFTTSVDCKLATGKDESFSSLAVKNGDITNIMDELATMKRPPNLLGSLIPEFTLHLISEKVIREAVEDKKAELKQSGTKIPAKDVDVLHLIDTSDLYGLINDGINRCNDHNTVQGFTNDMVGNTNDPTMVKGNNEATVANKLGKAKLVFEHKNNHGNTKLTNTELKFNSIIGAHIMEEKEGWFYGWVDTYDEWDD